MNYTPENKTGQIEIAKAVEINEAFQVTRQFLAHQVRTGVMKDPHTFINYTPHMSFVWGDDNIAYLKKRWELSRRARSSPAWRIRRIRSSSANGCP